MQVRTYPSLAAHDRDDAAYWRALPVDIRVLRVWKLSEEQWRGSWSSGPAPSASTDGPARRARTKDLGDIESLGEPV